MLQARTLCRPSKLMQCPPEIRHLILLAVVEDLIFEDAFDDMHSLSLVCREFYSDIVHVKLPYLLRRKDHLLREFRDPFLEAELQIYSDAAIEVLAEMWLEEEDDPDRLAIEGFPYPHDYFTTRASQIAQLESLTPSSTFEEWRTIMLEAEFMAAEHAWRASALRLVKEDSSLAERVAGPVLRTEDSPVPVLATQRQKDALNELFNFTKCFEMQTDLSPESVRSSYLRAIMGPCGDTVADATIAELYVNYPRHWLAPGGELDRDRLEV